MEPTGSSQREGQLCACGSPVRPRKGSRGPKVKRCDDCQRKYQAEATAQHRAKIGSEERSRRNISYKTSAAGTDAQLRYKYGISLAEYDQLLAEQNNGCAICAKTPEQNGRRLAVDHNHETGEVRGLLCSPCNQGIGLLQDNPAVVSKAAAYLMERGNYARNEQAGSL